MSIMPNRSELLGYWRRRLFWIWIAASLILAMVAAFGGPIISSTGSDGTTPIALMAPLAMFVLIVTGIGWLVLLVTSRRKR